MPEVDLQKMYEGVQALRQAVEKGWADQKEEVKTELQAEIKKVSEELDKKFAEAKAALDAQEIERKIHFAGGDESICKYGEPPALRKAINDVKKEYVQSVKGGGKAEDMKFQDFLSLVMSGYPGYTGQRHPMLEKLPRMSLNLDDMQTKRLLEDGGFFGIAASTGGYLVFPEYLAEIVPFLRQTGVVRRLARVMPMGGLIMQIPINTVGSTWAWIAEDGAKTDTDFAFFFGTLRNHMMYALTYVSNQMLADSRPSVQSYIYEDFGRGAGAAEDLAFLTGTGAAANPILGILVDPAVPAVPALAVFDFDDLIALWQTVQAALFGNPVRPGLLGNSAAIAHLAAVKDLNGQYIWQAPLTGTLDGSVGRVPFLGPCYCDENIPSAAGPPATTTLVYGDWNEAIIGDREEMIIMPNPYETTAFLHNCVAFRAERRVGWALRRATAFATLTGAIL